MMSLLKGTVGDHNKSASGHLCVWLVQCAVRWDIFTKPQIRKPEVSSEGSKCCVGQ